MDPGKLELRSMLIEAVDLLFDRGVMQFSGHGNISGRLDGDRMIISNKGQIEGLGHDDLSVVTFDGQVEDGGLPATVAEIVPMHAAVYRERQDAGAVIHTHSPHATMFAVAHQPLPCVYEALLRFGVADAIPVAAWGPRGSAESVSNIVTVLREHPTAPAVLLANHGLLAFGRDPIEAAHLVIAMEEAARVALGATALGGAQPFPPGALERERAHMERFSASARIQPDGSPPKSD